MKRLIAGTFAILTILVLAANISVAAQFIRADFNGDNQTDITDPISLLDYLFLSGQDHGCLDAGDINDDGKLDVSDVIYALIYGFQGGSAPPAPFPGCGDDPTADDLGCERSPCGSGLPNISSALGHCGGVPNEEYPNSLKPGNGLRKVTLDDAPLAICNDGSPAVFYVRSAPEGSPQANRWVFYFQGGGGCFTAEDCRERWCSIATVYDESKMSSLYTPDSIAATGIFSKQHDNVFSDWNHVYLYYCSSDGWDGQKSDVALPRKDGSEPSFSMHFRGHDIVDAVFTKLLQGNVVSDDRSIEMPPLDSADFAIISGFSAGSGGVQRNGDWLASRLEPNGTKVRLIFDGSFHPVPQSHPDPLKVPEIEEHLEGRYKLGYATASNPEFRNGFKDESARAALEGTENEWRLADGTYVALNHITTPFFINIDLIDNKVTDVYEPIGIGKGEVAQMAAWTYNNIRSLLQNATEFSSMTIAPASFNALCGTHTGLNSNTMFFNRTVDNAAGVPQNYHDTLVDWLQGSMISIVDDPLNPTTQCSQIEEERE